jgi:hypothetical protein
MIIDYLKGTTTPSSLKISSFLGMPPGLETSESDSADIDVQTEFERRGGYLFTDIFPDHEHCADGCCVGHKLPELSRKFLAKLKYPKDLACFILKHGTGLTKLTMIDLEDLVSRNSQLSSKRLA